MKAIYMIISYIAYIEAFAIASQVVYGKCNKDAILLNISMIILIMLLLILNGASLICMLLRCIAGSVVGIITGIALKVA